VVFGHLDQFAADLLPAEVPRIFKGKNKRKAGAFIHAEAKN
jgi:hypothetical protein